MPRTHWIWLLTIVGGVLSHTAAGEALEPGLHTGLPAVDPVWTYDLYLPKSYTPTVSLPVAIILPGSLTDPGDWVKQRMQAWSEQNNSAVFIIPSAIPSNEVHARMMKDPTWRFRTYVASLDKIPGLDHTVRVATAVDCAPGASGGMALWFAFMVPGTVSGLVFDVWNAGPQPQDRPVDYLALVELHPSRAAVARTPSGPADRNYLFEPVDRYLINEKHWEWNGLMRRNKAPFTMFDASCADKFDPDVVDDSLEFLVDSVLLTHPKVSAARRAVATSAIAQRLDAARTEANPVLRYRITDVISRLQGLKPAFQKEAVAAWRAAAADFIDPQPDDLARHELLTGLLADVRMKGAKEAKPLTARLKALKADTKCMNAVAAHAAAQDIIWQEWAGLNGSLQQQRIHVLKPGEPIIPPVRWMENAEAIKLLNGVIQRYPDTFARRRRKQKSIGSKPTVSRHGAHPYRSYRQMERE